MHWFKRLWRRPPRGRAAAPFRPRVDGLDERVVPAGFGHHHFFDGSALFGALDSGAEGADANVTRLAASLTGATGTSGSAHYHPDTTAGTNRLSLHVSGLAASQTFTVQIDGTTVGTLTTDANGAGRTSFLNLTATVSAGSVLTVLDPSGATVLSGTFSTSIDTGYGHGC
jgi:hypothetical protein